MNTKSLKLFAASAILATSISLLPGCHQVVNIENENIQNNSLLEAELNILNDVTSNYQRQKQIEKTYARINEESVKIREILYETADNMENFYTTGKDLMVVLEGKETVAWFSSNIALSDAYSAIASLNQEQNLRNKENVDYLNPSKIKYITENSTDGIDIEYSENGKLEINAPKEIKKIIICEVTPSKVKGLNQEQMTKYILNQKIDYNIPDYALTTLRHVEEVPTIYTKDRDTICVTYDGNYFETYTGFAEKDFASIPFFNFEFSALDKNNNIIYKA